MATSKFSVKTWLKSNPLVPLVAIVIAILIFVLNLLWSLNGEIREQKGTLSGFAKQIDSVSLDVKGLKTDVASLGSQVDFLNGEFVAQRLAAAAQDPQNPRSSRDAKNILTGLREKRVKVDPAS